MLRVNSSGVHRVLQRLMLPVILADDRMAGEQEASGNAVSGAEEEVLGVPVPAQVDLVIMPLEVPGQCLAKSPPFLLVQPGDHSMTGFREAHRAASVTIMIQQHDLHGFSVESTTETVARDDEGLMIASQSATAIVGLMEPGDVEEHILPVHDEAAHHVAKIGVADLADLAVQQLHQVGAVSEEAHRLAVLMIGGLDGEELTVETERDQDGMGKQHWDSLLSIKIPTFSYHLRQRGDLVVQRESMALRIAKAPGDLLRTLML